MFDLISSLFCLMLPMVMFTGAIVLFVFILKNNLKAAEKAKMDLGQLAQELRLNLKFGRPPHNNPTLQGNHLGVPVTVFETHRRRHNHNGGAQRYIYTTTYRVALNPNHVPLGLNVFKEGFTSKLGKMVGGQDIQLNDEVFDKTFIIRGNSDNEVREFFERPNIKKYLIWLNTAATKFYLHDNTLHFESERQMLYEVPAMRDRLEKLVHCSLAISGQNLIPPATRPPILEQPTELQNTNNAW